MFWSYVHKNAHHSRQCKLFILIDEQAERLFKMLLDFPGATMKYLDCYTKGFIFKCIISNMRKIFVILFVVYLFVFLSLQFLQLICMVTRWQWGRQHKRSKVVLILKVSEMIFFLIGSKECLKKNICKGDIFLHGIERVFYIVNTFPL